MRGDGEKAREPLYEDRGEQDELLECSVGEGDEVIISMSAGEQGGGLLPRPKPESELAEGFRGQRPPFG